MTSHEIIGRRLDEIHERLVRTNRPWHIGWVNETNGDANIDDHEMSSVAQSVPRDLQTILCALPNDVAFLIISLERCLESMKKIERKVPHAVSREEAADMACEFKIEVVNALAALRDLSHGGAR